MLYVIFWVKTYEHATRVKIVENVDFRTKNKQLHFPVYRTDCECDKSAMYTIHLFPSSESAHELSAKCNLNPVYYVYVWCVKLIFLLMLILSIIIDSLVEFKFFIKARGTRSKN